MSPELLLQSQAVKRSSGQAVGKKLHAKAFIIGMWFAYMSILNMSVIYLFCSCRTWSNDFLFFPSDVVVLRLPRPKSSTGSRKILRSSTPSLLCGAEKVPSFGPVVTALAVPRSLNGFHSPRPVQRDGQLQSHAMGRCSIYELNWTLVLQEYFSISNYSHVKDFDGSSCICIQLYIHRCLI